MVADASPNGFVGRRPDERGVCRLKQQNREVALTTKGWLYGIDKAQRYIRQYRTVIFVEGIFDYFAFCNLLQGQDKPVVDVISRFFLKHLKTDAQCSGRG